MSSITTMPSFEVTDEGSWIVVRFPPGTTLTEVNSDAVGRELAALMQARDRPHLWLELGDVDLLSSAALGMLVGLNRRARAAGARLTLAAPTPHVREVLAVTRLDRVLDVQPADGAGRPEALRRSA